MRGRETHGAPPPRPQPGVIDPRTPNLRHKYLCRGGWLAFCLSVVNGKPCFVLFHVKHGVSVQAAIVRTNSSVSPPPACFT